MTIRVSLKKEVPGFSLDVDWEVGTEIGVVFGYSGSGKSLSLQLIAGLLTPDSGKIQANGTVFFDTAAGIDLPPQQRRIGFVFQDSSLFPHMTVADNIRFGLRDQVSESGERNLLEMARTFEIEDVLEKHPDEISGGQKQRVAFARALVGAPLALLLDEPFSALDNPIRTKLRNFLREIQKKFKVPIILVTHDIFEAYSMADRIIIYSNGRVIQTGKPSEVFGNPGNPQVKNLLDVEEFCKCGIFKQRVKSPPKDG